MAWDQCGLEGILLLCERKAAKAQILLKVVVMLLQVGAAKAFYPVKNTLERAFGGGEIALELLVVEGR